MRQVLASIQILIFAIWSVSCILFASTVCLLTFSKKPTVFFAKWLWSPVAILIFLGRLEIRGKQHYKPGIPYVVMSNHCSYLDIPSLLLAFPDYLYFVAKKELKKMPFLGWFMILAGMIFIDRKNTASAKESLREAAKLIENGKHVVIYPEGTASKTGELASFKKGGFHLADDANASIFPVLIEGTFKVWPSGNKLKTKPGKIIVTLGEPINPATYRKFELESRIEFVRNTILNLKHGN